MNLSRSLRRMRNTVPCLLAASVLAYWTACSSDADVTSPQTEGGAEGEGEAGVDAPSAEGEGEGAADGEGGGDAEGEGAGEGEGEGEGEPTAEGEGEDEGGDEGEEPDDGTCPRPPADGEPNWCLDLVERFNTSEVRDLDGDDEDDFWGVREYLITRAILVGQDPASPRSMEGEGYPFRCEYLLLVPHGGAIEGGTEQLARAMLQRLPQSVGESVVAWIVGGRNSTRNHCASCAAPDACPLDCHHVRSTAIEPDCPPKVEEEARERARLPRVLDLCPTGMSIHGHARAELRGREMVVVGGADAPARAELVALLRREIAAGRFNARLVVVDSNDILDAQDVGREHLAAGLTGTHKCNVVNRFEATRDGPGIQLELPESVRPSGVRINSPEAADPEHPLYMHRHEAQTLLGDPSIMAEILSRFICERLGGEEDCRR